MTLRSRLPVPCAIACIAALVGFGPRLASACSEAIPGLFVPYFDAGPVPQNFRFVRWREQGQDAGYELLDATGERVPLRRERLGGRVDTLPAKPVEPGRYVFHRQGVDEMPLVVRGGADTTPPTLRAVSRPRVVHYPGTGCGTGDDTSIRIDATDDSPFFIAVWGSARGEPDLADNPVLYARIEGGAIELWAARQRLGLEAGQGSWAVMGIDVAGNRSDVVFTPSQRRVPGVLFAATSAEVPPPGAPDPTPDEDESRPVSQDLPAAPRPHGCGCEALGADAPALGWAAPLLALAARRRRRPYANAGSPPS